MCRDPCWKINSQVTYTLLWESHSHLSLQKSWQFMEVTTLFSFMTIVHACEAIDYFLHSLKFISARNVVLNFLLQSLLVGLAPFNDQLLWSCIQFQSFWLIYPLTYYTTSLKKLDIITSQRWNIMIFLIPDILSSCDAQLLGNFSSMVVRVMTRGLYFRLYRIFLLPGANPPLLTTLHHWFFGFSWPSANLISKSPFIATFKDHLHWSYMVFILWCTNL